MTKYIRGNLVKCQNQENQSVKKSSTQSINQQVKSGITQPVIQSVINGCTQSVNVSVKSFSAQSVNQSVKSCSTQSVKKGNTSIEQHMKIGSTQLVVCENIESVKFDNIQFDKCDNTLPAKKCKNTQSAKYKGTQSDISKVIPIPKNSSKSDPIYKSTQQQRDPIETNKNGATDQRMNPQPNTPVPDQNFTNNSSYVDDNSQIKGICLGCLNVCGLKRRLEYPEFNAFINQHDILCLAETKLDDTDIISVDQYTFYSKPRRQAYLRKSGGLGFFARNDISKHLKQVHTESEYIFCLSLSKHFHQSDQDILIMAVYVPPQQSRFFSNDEFELFENDVTRLCSQYDCIITMGDFNAQTGDLEDYTSADSFFTDFFDFDQETIEFYNQKCALENLGINLQRKNLDKKKNNLGYRLIDICKNHNLTILNGRFGQDKIRGEMTFRNTSVIDYAIVSTKCISMLRDFQIIDLDRIYSDGHSLLKVTLNVNIPKKVDSGSKAKQNSQSFLNPSQYQNFTNNFDPQKVLALLNDIQTCDKYSNE